MDESESRVIHGSAGICCGTGTYCMGTLEQVVVVMDETSKAS